MGPISKMDPLNMVLQWDRGFFVSFRLSKRHNLKSEQIGIREDFGTLDSTT